MEIEEVFKSPFKLVFSYPPYYSPIKLPGVRFVYRTEEIESSTTTEEIFNLSQMYLKETIEKYNHYQVERAGRTIKTTYRLYIAWEVEKDGLKELEEKDLYETTYNIEEEEITQIEEKEYYLPPETIERKFFIFMVPTVYVLREGEQTIKSPKCVICYHNPPNILYYNCLHITVCNSCDEVGKLLKCPLCRTKIKNQRIKI